jgi:hypothetical protein
VNGTQEGLRNAFNLGEGGLGFTVGFVQFAGGVVEVVGGVVVVFLLVVVVVVLGSGAHALALREVPEIGVWGEKRIRIGIAKDGSGVGAALIALVADKAMKGESSFSRPAGFAGYVNSFISYINRGIRHM